MKFLADMAISQSTVNWLRERQHDVVHLRDEGLQRASDDDILAKARTEERILLTLDLDFGYLLAVSGESLPSVVIFRLGNESADVVTRRLSDTLTCCEADLQQGAIVTVAEDTIRVRYLPVNRE